MMRVKLLACALLLGTARLATAQPGLDSLVPPSPQPAGFIADGGPVLDSAAKARLNARIVEVQRATGGDIGVAIIRDLHDRAPVDAGVAIYRAWKIGRIDSIGSARRALGALLLIVPKELAPSGKGECWITTGRGAEGELNDATAGTICRDSVIPYLRTRAYESAVGAGISGIAVTFDRTVANLGAPATVGIGSSDTGHRARNRSLALVGGLLTVFGGIGGAVGYRRFRRNRPRQCPRGHGPMTRLSEAADDAELQAGARREETLGSVDYDVWACPSCSERIVIAYKAWHSPYGQCAHCGFRTVTTTRETLVGATMLSTGLEEITLACDNCGRTDRTRRVIPRIPPPSTSSSSGSGGGGGSSFGGSGSTAGGGGGSSY
jgi:uncharacterized protein